MQVIRPLSLSPPGSLPRAVMGCGAGWDGQLAQEASYAPPCLQGRSVLAENLPSLLQRMFHNVTLSPCHSFHPSGCPPAPAPGFKSSSPHSVGDSPCELEQVTAPCPKIKTRNFLIACSPISAILGFSVEVVLTGSPLPPSSLLLPSPCIN